MRCAREALQLEPCIQVQAAQGVDRCRAFAIALGQLLTLNSADTVHSCSVDWPRRSVTAASPRPPGTTHRIGPPWKSMIVRPAQPVGERGNAEGPGYPDSNEAVEAGHLQSCFAPWACCRSPCPATATAHGGRASLNWIPTKPLSPGRRPIPGNIRWVVPASSWPAASPDPGHARVQGHLRRSRVAARLRASRTRRGKSGRTWARRGCRRRTRKCCRSSWSRSRSGSVQPTAGMGFRSQN